MSPLMDYADVWVMPTLVACDLVNPGLSGAVVGIIL